MSLDMPLDLSTGEARLTGTDDLVKEVRRQSQICNACRYCEGYCSVFPSMHRHRMFTDGDLTHFAQICHNCRGCYYACQFTAPHEYDLNLPAALAQLRQDTWQRLAWPGFLADRFHRHGTAIAAALVLAFALIFALAQALRPDSGEGFYAYMSHSVMVAIFAPAFLLPLAAIGLSLRRYWGETAPIPLAWSDLVEAGKQAAQMKNLKGGHGDGCNFENGDRFTHARRHAHQAMLWGFVLCFASTSSGTVLHYVFGLEAPYGFFSLPKLLGVPGGILMTIGAIGLWGLKKKADPELGAKDYLSGDYAFIALLGAVAVTGLALYAATGSGAVSWLLPVHLGTVLTLFLLTPYSKMAHGFYRFTALAAEAARKRALAA
jgi:citrate/tricarballylate utilization protein